MTEGCDAYNFPSMKHHLCQSCTMGGSSNGSGMSTKDSAGFGHEGHNGFSISKMTIAGNGIRVARRAWDAKVPVQLPDSPTILAGFANPTTTRMKLV